MENVMENTKVTPPQLGKPKIKQRNKKVFVDVSQRADIKLLEAIKSNKVDEISSSEIKLLDDYVKDTAQLLLLKKPQTLNEALAKFQTLNVTATMDTTNTYFKNTYSDINSVIIAVNHGSQFGLSFTQSVNYKTHTVNITNLKTDAKSGNTLKSKQTDMVRDIFVETTMYHDVDPQTRSCVVPVLIKGADKDDPQKMGSAITYAKRYGLQALYGLASDDDGNTASGKTNETQQGSIA